MASHPRPVDFGLLLVVGLIWGAAFPAITVGLHHFSPLLFASFRFDIAAPLLLLVAYLRRPASLRIAGARQWTAIAIGAILNVAVYHLLLFWGQQFTTPGIAGVIIGLNPVLTVFASRVFLPQDHVDRWGVLGLASGLAGIGVLSYLRGGRLTDAQGLGELAVFGSIAAWALGSVLIKRQAHAMDAYAFLGWQCAFGAILLNLSTLAFEGGGSWSPTGSGWAALAYLAFISTGIGTSLYFVLLERIGPIRVNLVSHISAVVATITGMILLGDLLEWRAVWAFVLIAAGFWLVVRRPAPKKTPAGSPTSAP